MKIYAFSMLEGSAKEKLFAKNGGNMVATNIHTHLTSKDQAAGFAAFTELLDSEKCFVNTDYS